MTKIQNSKTYDLEDRTLAFAKNVRAFLKRISNTLTNIEDGRQLVKASGSIGANHIEANEALGKKDFMMRIKICRKEAKESRYWLRPIDTTSEPNLEKGRRSLEQEATELMNIFVLSYVGVINVLNICISDLFRISIFGFRIFK